MGNMVINLNDYDENDSGFTAIEKGKYEAVINEVELQTSQKGSEMIKWTFELTEVGYQKRKLFLYTVLDVKFGLALLKKIILSTGYQCDLNNFNVEDFCSSGDIVGFPICLKVGLQNYDGEKRNTIKDVMPSSVNGDAYF